MEADRGDASRPSLDCSTAQRAVKLDKKVVIGIGPFTISGFCISILD